jgi:hypothetical protein
MGGYSFAKHMRVKLSLPVLPYATDSKFRVGNLTFMATKKAGDFFIR